LGSRYDPFNLNSCSPWLCLAIIQGFYIWGQYRDLAGFTLVIGYGNGFNKYV